MLPSSVPDTSGGRGHGTHDRVAANVVFVGNFLYPEGLAETKRIQHFIDAVVAIPGNSASVLLLRQSHPGRDDARLTGVQRGVSYTTIGHVIGHGLRGLGGLLGFIRDGVRFLRRARVPGVTNAVYLYGEPNVENIVFVLAAKALGYLLVADIVEDQYLIGPDASLASRLKASSSGFATRHMGWFVNGVIVISSFLRDKFERISGGRLPVEHVPIAVDLAAVPMVTGPFHRPVQVFYAGSFGDKDGVENLVLAFEQAAAAGADVELVMTGRSTPARMAALQARIAQSPAAARIRYLGFLPDGEYFAALGRCDVPCVVRVPSAFAERGFPFKLGEYLATGRPVIAAAVGDVGHYLAHRHSALLVEPGSVSDIVAALQFILANEAAAAAIGRAGRLVAEQHFSASRNGRQLLDLIGRLAGRRR